MKQLSSVAVACAMLIGCEMAPGVWMRTDGQSAKNDPVLARQFQTDRTACMEERQQAGLSGATAEQGGGSGGNLESMRTNEATDIIRDCMARKGYMIVPKEEAEQRGEEARGASDH